MAILPLPQFEADLEADRKTYEALKTPKTLVVRFGVLKLVGEFFNESGAKPGCGSKLVLRTHRGTEIGEMLTSTCPNSGCSKSVSRQEMLQYVENSGGRDYPFFQEGRVLRVATPEDMTRQSELEQSRHGLRMQAKAIVEEMELPIKIVDAETILGNERLFMYYYSEERIDLRDLAPRLARLFHNRVELRQVGARDEARITADYERCGQYCCCKNFLKVLKPISMKSAKIQKATLDPLKISGRCGRLMCCLRYEDETYETLRKRLPKKKSRVGTPEGDGFVIDSQILTQLVLVQLDIPEPDGKIRQVAVPVESLTEPISKTQPPPPQMPPPGFSRGAGSRPGPSDRRGGPGADQRQPDQRQPDQRQTDQRQTDQRQSEQRKPDARGPEQRPSARDPLPREDRPREDRPRDARPPQRPPSGQSLPQNPSHSPRPGPRPNPPQGRPPSGHPLPPRPDDQGRRQDGPRKPPPPPQRRSAEADDFSLDEIDDLIAGPDPDTDGPAGAQGQGDMPRPDSGNAPEGDPTRRRRKRRRRRGRGGPPGASGPSGPGPQGPPQS